MINRRRFLVELTRFACTLPALSVFGVASAQIKDSPFRQEAMAGWRRRINTILKKGRLPILDLQATYVEGKTKVSQMIEYMDEFDIAQTAFAPFGTPTGAPSLELYRQYPEYIIPTTNSGESSRWYDDPLTFLAAARKDLESGSYFFMGEHEFRHYPSPEQVKAGRADRDITVDIAGSAGQGLFALSEKFGVAFQIHYDIEDRLLGPLESMLARYPKAQVIWCHLGQVRYPDRTQRYHPEYVRGLIGRFPGLHFDLAVAPPGAIYKPSGAAQSTLYRNGRLDKDWKQLIEQHPDRFLSASDYRPSVANNYPAMITRQRELILDPLSEPARHLVAFGNAWRLITGSPWSS